MRRNATGLRRRLCNMGRSATMIEKMIWSICTAVVVMMIYILTELHYYQQQQHQTIRYTRQLDGSNVLYEDRAAVDKAVIDRYVVRKLTDNSHHDNHKNKHRHHHYDIFDTANDENVKHAMEQIDGYIDYGDSSEAVENVQHGYGGAPSGKYSDENNQAVRISVNVRTAARNGTRRSTSGDTNDDEIMLDDSDVRNNVQHQHNNKHLYISTPGRLGNQMFQYAAGYFIAATQNFTPVLPVFTAMELQRIFTLHDAYDVKNPKPGLETFNEIGAGIYTQSLLELPHKDLSMCCYFQSWHYLNERITRKQLFKFKPQILHAARTTIRNLLQEYLSIYKQRYKVIVPVDQLVYVGLHVRRTDFTLDTSHQQGYRAAPMRYILKAIAFYESIYKHIIFVASSDDKQWLRDNLQWKPNVLVIAGTSDAIDLCALSQCNHTIITTGTFGWWAGYLAGGQVTYYSKWLQPESEIGKVYNSKDYFPPTWVAIGD